MWFALTKSLMISHEAGIRDIWYILLMLILRKASVSCSRSHSLPGILKFDARIPNLHIRAGRLIVHILHRISGVIMGNSHPLSYAKSCAKNFYSLLKTRIVCYKTMHILKFITAK